MFDLLRARSLHAVRVHGSIARAAAHLHITGSALSQQLAKLEREIGQPLLVRRGRGVELTDAGVFLAEGTADLLDRMARIEAALAVRRGTVVGRLVIAAFATATRSILPAALRELRRRYPDLTVESRENEPAEALALLDQGAIDLAIIDEWFNPAPVLPDRLCYRKLLEDSADLAVPAGHVLADLPEPLDLADCAPHRWITWRAGEFGHDWLRRAVAGYRGDERFHHTASEHQSILMLVEAGLGIALMPRLGRGPVPPDVRIKTVAPAPTRTLYLVWRAHDDARPAIRAALETLDATGTRRSSPPAPTDQTVAPEPGVTAQ